MYNPRDRRDLQYIKDVFDSLGGPQQTGPVLFVVSLLLWYLMFLGLTVEIYVRRRMGTRYFGPLQMILAFFCYMVFPIFYGAVYTYDGGRPYGPINIYWFILLGFLFLLISLSHITIGGWMNWKTQRWHTMDMGITHLEWLNRIPGIRLDKWQIYRLEPILFMTLGWSLWQIDPLIAGWLMVAGFGLYIRIGMSYSFNRNRLMDIRDAEIEAGSLHAQLSTQNRGQWGYKVTPAKASVAPAPDTPDIAHVMQETLNGAHSDNDESQHILDQGIEDALLQALQKGRNGSDTGSADRISP